MNRDHHPLQASLTPGLVALVVMVLILTSALGQSPASARPKDQPAGAMHDVITEQALKAQVAGASKLSTALSARTSAVGDVRPSSGNSLLTSSIVLFDGEKFTLVPVGSILNLPRAHRRRVVPEPTGEFTFWPSFLERNASWLRAKEVPLKMAKGDAKSAEAVLKETSGDARVVVSVYKGGAISILEPETPKEKGPSNR